MGAVKRFEDSIRLWRVNRHERHRARELGSAQSVALGFAWPATNVGGVRRHLECIEKYSEFPIALYPGARAVEMLDRGSLRNAYHANLCAELDGRHALFHSHVDPVFIGVSERARKTGKPWVHTYHLLYFAGDWNGNLQPWQVQINESLLGQAKNADVCLSVGNWLVEWLQLHHGIQSIFVPNGVDVQACDSSEPSRFLELLQIESFVLYVNSIASVKNPASFVEAARRLPNLPFVMIGTGLDKSNIEKTLEIEIPGNLIPLGPLPQQEALDAIAACSVFVMTSHREGLPTVLLEAMAMQKPCVVPDAPWFADAIQTEAHGLKYEPGNIDDLVRNIELALALGPRPAARERVEKHFAWPVVIRQIDQVYRQLLG